MATPKDQSVLVALRRLDLPKAKIPHLATSTTSKFRFGCGDSVLRHGLR